MQASNEQLLWMYRRMQLIRHYEDTLAMVYFEGKLPPQIQKGLAFDIGGGISDQAGSLMAKMLYGATQDGAHEHYDEAVRLAPDHVVPHVEYARGLDVMYGDSERASIREKLERALQVKAWDAMQRMDQEAGRKQLAALQG